MHHRIAVKLGDGNYGGEYQRPDEEMMDIWSAGVEETCHLLDNVWVAPMHN